MKAEGGGIETVEGGCSSHIGNILVQEEGQGGGSNVHDIFDATLI